MNKLLSTLVLLTVPLLNMSTRDAADYGTVPEPYTSYFTGDRTDVETSPQFGITMMGGRSEHNNAMRWFLQHADGGDILVLRATGSDGYNNYLFSELGVAVNSVETLVINNAAAANHPYVLQQIANAEAIWFAGGNQHHYYSIWGNSPMKNALNRHINVKRGVVGGTSAGMAILGEWVYTAAHGSIVSGEALANPFDTRLTLANDFLEVPYLRDLVTDTHYHERNREGRHSAFMARIVEKTQSRVFGIACDEYTAVNIDADGIARIYGNSPETQQAVYFIQSSCETLPLPEVLAEGKPLTWNMDNKALIVYKVTGTKDGQPTFNLNNWKEGSGGEWLHWFVQNGTWQTSTAKAPDCH